MAASKTARTLKTSAAVSAGATSSVTELNLSTAYGAMITVRLTNGSSAPTTVPVVKFYIGESTGTKRLFWQASGDLIASSVNDIVCEIPASVMFANADIIGGATNGLAAAEAYAQELTTV